MSARSTIVKEFERVAAERDKKLAPLSDDLKLLDSGLDSLSFAVLVIRLEERELTARFGSAYTDYRQRVPAFLPLKFW